MRITNLEFSELTKLPPHMLMLHVWNIVPTFTQKENRQLVFLTKQMNILPYMWNKSGNMSLKPLVFWGMGGQFHQIKNSTKHLKFFVETSTRPAKGWGFFGAQKGRPLEALLPTGAVSQRTYCPKGLVMKDKGHLNKFNHLWTLIQDDLSIVRC